MSKKIPPKELLAQGCETMIKLFDDPDLEGEMIGYDVITRMNTIKLDLRYIAAGLRRDDDD